MKKLNISRLVKQLRSSNQKSLILRSDQLGRPLTTLNYLIDAGKVEQHDLAVDITHILEGEGILESDGKILEKIFSSPHEWRGEALGGCSKTGLKPGMIVTIEAGVPHRTIPRKGKPLVYMTFKQYLDDYLMLEKFDLTIVAKIAKVKALIMDVDGTMTDGKVAINAQGEEFASFSRIDSMGIGQLQKANFKVGMISKEKVSIATARAEKLKIDCYIGIEDKVAQAHKLISSWGIPMGQVCFIGDDVNDLLLLKEAGLSTCPGDAHPFVLKVVDFVLPQKRGNHVIRELTDLILSVQGKL